MILDENLLQRVELALDTIRPYLAADGGNVSIEEITDDFVVKLKLLGSCESCPMSMMTLKAGIEIKAVEALNITPIDDPNAVLPSQT
jgi:Fe-S cluster biogenesis protein NfuA